MHPLKCLDLDDKSWSICYNHPAMDVKRSVCLINDSFPPVIDGVATTVLNYANLLPDCGISPTVVTPHYPGADDSVYPFPVIRYPSINTEKSFGYRTGNFLSPDALAALTQSDSELIHSHCPITSTLLGRIFRRAVPMPMILTYHSKFEIDIARALKGKLLQEEAIRQLVINISACDEVWAVSRGAGEGLKALGFEGDYIVMPNGVDLPKGRTSQALMDTVTEGLDLPEGIPLFLYVGRMMWYKGIRITLDALDALNRRGMRFNMVFIGGGSDKEEMMDYAEKLGLCTPSSSGRVLFLDPIYDREKLRAWYSRADLFLFPSSYDTNGLVVREAAAAALPSVLLKGSCAAEDVNGDVDGFLIDENAESMAAMLAKICQRPDYIRQVGQAAQDNLYLSWADSVKNAAERYEIVLDNYRRGLYPVHEGPDDKILNSMTKLLCRYNERRSREYDARHQLQRRMRKGERAAAWTDFFALSYEETHELLDQVAPPHEQEDW